MLTKSVESKIRDTIIRSHITIRPISNGQGSYRRIIKHIPQNNINWAGKADEVTSQFQLSEMLQMYECTEHNIND